MGGDDALEVIHRAERIVWAAGWRLQEQTVLEQLAGTCGLGRARLEPRSDVIQLVTYDGEHLGHVRRENPYEPQASWVAVLKGRAPQAGSYSTALAAAEATPKVALRYGPDRLQQCPRSRHTWLIPDTLTMAMGPATKRTSRC
jgi:hypothetical protein